MMKIERVCNGEIMEKGDINIYGGILGPVEIGIRLNNKTFYTSLGRLYMEDYAPDNIANSINSSKTFLKWKIEENNETK